MNENQTNQDNFKLSESPKPTPAPTPIPTWDIPIEKQFAATLVSHNTFFELVFQLQRVACALLRFLLPQQLLDEIDLDKLTVSVRHFRDGNFQESRADMVYVIPLKNATNKHIKIYIVTEHKSYNDSHTMSQLLKYEQQIIDNEIHLAKTEGRYTVDFKLPPIILIIFHHGEGIYTRSVELADEFEQIAGTEDYRLKQKAILFDLSTIEKNDLPRDPNAPELYVSLRIMQVIMSQNLDNILSESDLCEELKPHYDKPECQRFARLFMFYVLDSNRNLTDHGKQNLNQQIQNNLKGKIMIPPIGERYAKIGIKKGITIGESRGMKRGINIGESRGIKKGIDIGESRGIAKGIEKGIDIGESRGIAKGKAEGIISILDVKFGEISETVRDSLYAVTDNDRLKSLLRFAAKCESFEEFYNELKSTK